MGLGQVGGVWCMLGSVGVGLGGVWTRTGATLALFLWFFGIFDPVIMSRGGCNAQALVAGYT